MTTNFDRAPRQRNLLRKNKWNWYPPDVIPMWLAVMDFPSSPPVLEALRKSLRNGVLGYELPSAALQETVAARMDRLYGWKVPPESVLATTGVVSGFNLAARAFCTSRRGCLIQPPVYNEFFEIQDNLFLPLIQAPLIESFRRGFLEYEIDWEAFEKQVKKAGMFLLCSPHNPVGKIFSRADLLRMARICIENGVVIVSDEIHSELLLGGAKFTPTARLSREIANHTVTFVSPSKTFNTAGLFCGFAVIPSAQLRARFNEVLERSRMHVGNMGLFAAQAAMSGECDPWLEDLRAYLTGNRDALIDYIREYLPEVRITRPNATYLAWLDFSDHVRFGRIEGSPFEFFLQKARVAFSDGAVFGKKYHAYVRLNFGCTRGTLMQALERIRKALYS